MKQTTWRAFRVQHVNFKNSDIVSTVSTPQKNKWNNTEIMILKLDQQAQKVANKFKYNGELGSLKLKMDIKHLDQIKVDYQYKF